MEQLLWLCVLSRDVLSPKTQTNLKNAKSYFAEHLSVGDYYGENARVQGEWFGEGAVKLELIGSVAAHDFLALCENQHPQTRERLTQRRDAVRRVFYDFTFSPPKSVSVAALVSTDKRITLAHAKAVKIALGELEQFASARLRSRSRNSDRRTGNFVAALFQHETSRALDPHLHTHCIIFNATYDNTESRWKALQNYEMLNAQKYAENAYYHELARSLREFGYTVVNKGRGDFEIAEVAQEICERFSKRHREIDEKTRAFLTSHPEKRVGNEKEIREHIAHKERAKKNHQTDSGKLRKFWRDQLSTEELDSLHSQSRVREDPRELSASEAVTWAERHLFERRSVVREHELWRHALEAVRGSATSLAKIKQETASRDYLRSENDKVAHPEVLAREWEIVQAARDGVGVHTPLAPRVTADGNQLTSEQSRALDAILWSTNFITLFRGGAGTGKSFVLKRVQQALDKAGRTSLVLAPQRQQVIDLHRDGLTATQTVAECLQRQDLQDRAVVIVDEAGQISGRQLFDLIRLVKERRGRLILSGDTRQHGPVEASDALRAIERYSGLRAAEVSEIRRQDSQRGRTMAERKRIKRYREAVEAAAAGDLSGSFRKLEALDAIIECDAVAQSDKLTDAYLQIVASGESAIVVSQTRAEVRAVNEAIRKQLRDRGFLSQDESQVTALEQVDLTAAQKLDLRHYPARSIVVFNRNFRNCMRGQQAKIVGLTARHLVLEVSGKIRQIPRNHFDKITVCLPHVLDLCAGDRLQLRANSTTSDGKKIANGEIVSVGKISATGAIRLEDGRILPPHYRQFQRGYAVTSYGSQGKTIDHVLFSDAAVRAASNAQQWYVTISRGRKSIKIFTPDKEHLRHAIERSGDRELALDLIRQQSSGRRKRYNIIRSIRRGREFARRICLMTMRSWSSQFLRRDLNQQHENRYSQTNRPNNARVLAA
jgi:conjugative relaxase-like TrwC/TraI family protein